MGNTLGELEHIVLAAVIGLGDDAWGAAILRDIEEHADRRVSSGALSVTLDRLERKGLVESRIGEPEPGRGGRPKRYVRATPEGVRAVREAQAALLALWSRIRPRPGKA